MSTELAGPVEVVFAFLDNPMNDAKSAVGIEFSPVPGLQTPADAIFYITKLGPIPFLLRRQGNVEAKEMAVESIGGPTKLRFCRVPSTGSLDADLAEIMGWFDRSGISVEILPIDVTAWFREQFSGSEIRFGIAIEPGWISIVVDVCQQIQTALTAAELRQFCWIQIAQDDGKLVMRWRLHEPMAASLAGEFGPESEEIGDDRRVGAGLDLAASTQQSIGEFIAIAQKRASRTCEYCGASGKLRYQPTITVLCDACQENWEQALSEEFAVTSWSKLNSVTMPG